MPVPAPPRSWCWRHASTPGPACYRSGHLAPGPCRRRGLRPVAGRGAAAGRTLRAMVRRLLESRLSDVATQLRGLRRELAVTDEQLAQLADEADDARLRSLVSETPLAEREHREPPATPRPWAGTGPRSSARSPRLEQLQDELLDRAHRDCRLTRYDARRLG